MHVPERILVTGRTSLSHLISDGSPLSISRPLLYTRVSLYTLWPKLPLSGLLSFLSRPVGNMLELSFCAPNCIRFIHKLSHTHTHTDRHTQMLCVALTRGQPGPPVPQTQGPGPDPVHTPGVSGSEDAPAGPHPERPAAGLPGALDGTGPGQRRGG